MRHSNGSATIDPDVDLAAVQALVPGGGGGLTAVTEDPAAQSNPSRDGDWDDIPVVRPKRLKVRIQGVASMLFHRYDCDAVQAKSDAQKGSEEKKTDNVESYYYRKPGDRTVCVPAVGLHGAMREAAKNYKDPRSTRKSAHDLIKAVILVEGPPEFEYPELIPVSRHGAPIMVADFLDKRRVVVQMNAVPRVRPGVMSGWEAEFYITLLAPQYCGVSFARRLLMDAGAFQGLCDFRPSFGRFHVVAAEEILMEDGQTGGLLNPPMD